MLCALLKVAARASTPGGPGQSARTIADEVLTVQIRGHYDANRKLYGSPRMFAELADAGVHVGRKRVARLMRAAAQVVGYHRRKRSFSIITQDPKAVPAPDQVDPRSCGGWPSTADDHAAGHVGDGGQVQL